MGSPAESGSVGMSAIELADAIRGRVLDPVQVTAAHLERIRAVDPVVRAFVEVFEQEALAELQRLHGETILRHSPWQGFQWRSRTPADRGAQGPDSGRE